MSVPRETIKPEQRLSDGTLRALADLVEHLGLTAHFAGEATLYGSDPVIRSPHHLGEASGIAQLLIGIADAAIWHQRQSILSTLSTSFTPPTLSSSRAV
jgi:hypothetical protein